MLYFFHHYELPVILQQAQLQQLLLRTHRGMAGMMGLAGITALASGAAYHDAPGTATQATPPTTQSTTQTVQNTVQSTTQTTPSVSTVQTNTTHTGDVVSTRPPELVSTENNTGVTEDERPPAPSPIVQTKNADKDAPLPNTESSIKIEEIKRKDSIKIESSGNSVNHIQPSVAPITPTNENTIVTTVNVEPLTLDRRRKEDFIGELSADNPPSAVNQETETLLAPRASSEGEEID